MSEPTERTVNCDQVAWMLDVFDRYLPPDNFPRVSRQREALKYGMLYELMDVAGLCFADSDAERNGTPPDARSRSLSSAKGKQ